MTIQQILLELRARHGSIEEVANHYGVNRDYLYRLYSGGKKNPTPEFLAKLGVVVSYQFK